MSLQRQQDIFARLYTDSEFRKEFLNDPGAFAEGLGVTSPEARGLATFGADELSWFSESLYSKRLREVRKMLPMTEEALGTSKFAETFREFSDGFSSVSVKKHLEDSLALSNFLVRSPSIDPRVRNIALFESSRLFHNAVQKRFSLCFLRYDPRAPVSEGRSTRRGFGLWIAIGKWSRIVFRAKP